MHFHLSLNCSDIPRSVAFYEKVFGMPAAKCRPDYAKFEVADPPLVLSLEPTAPSGRGSLNHVGLRLSDAPALVDLQRRLELAGYKTQREEGVECCYAKQTKFWLHDPDGVLWEFYVLEGDIEHRGAGQVPDTLPVLQAAQDAASASVAASASPSKIWEHTLGSPFPVPLPHADGSLEEIRLRGTFNDADREAERDRLLSEAARVLAPSGRLMLHNLTANGRLDRVPELPGPAAYVTAVPPLDDLLASLKSAGFGDVRLTKHAASPCFTSGGVEMRETMIEAVTTA